MLTATEQLLFTILAIVFGGLTAAGFYGIFRIIRSGREAPPLSQLPRWFISALVTVGLQKTVFRARPVLSVFHTFIFLGFSFYFLVNVADVLEGFIPGFELVYGGRALAERWPQSSPLVEIGAVNMFNLVADVLSVLTLLGMVVFLLRRFLANDRRLKFNAGVMLHPRVSRGGIRLDSAIVGLFILTHVGSRFSGQALRLALNGEPDPFMPFATLMANAFSGLSISALNIGIHATWWLAVGLILVFFPYFVRSKHIHLMIAPLNLALGKQEPRGALDPVLLNGNGSAQAPGAKYLLDLPWPRLLDGYACIMCNRCHDVCPAHHQGWSLSPSAMEINKRYMLNDEFLSLARGVPSTRPLLDTMISPEAVWACTTCYACVRVCPVGNEPMADIVDIRRRMVFDGDPIDAGIQSALESLARNGNWFGKSRRHRSRWAKDLEFGIKDATQQPVEYLWFVGDTASFDERVIPLTQKVARILEHAGVDFGILYNEERNAGNDVRRVGEEGLFEQLVEENLEVFGRCQFDQILTTDPHSLNTLRNEYPRYKGMWQVHHYAQFILDLIETGKLTLKHQLSHYLVTYHDPCYLGRYNGGFAGPRNLLKKIGVQLVEMPRNRENSFCCGAGGGQIWMSKTLDGERPAENRIREAIKTLSPQMATNGAANNGKMLFVVACPKDVIMYTDAVKTTGNEDVIEVRDIVQLVEESLGWVDREFTVVQRPLVEPVPG